MYKRNQKYSTIQANYLQKLTYIMKDKEAAKAYISSFIEEKGGIPKVMKETGLGKQTVWQLSEKRNAASPKTIDAFVAAYPDFDAQAARGIVLVRASGGSDPTPGVELTYWRNVAENALHELTELRTELKELKDELKSWQGAYKLIVNKSMGIDQQGIKIGSDSQNTAEDKDCRNEQEVYGLIRYYDKVNAEAGAKVIRFTPEVPVIALRKSA
jgi:hypothetical protein